MGPDFKDNNSDQIEYDKYALKEKRKKRREKSLDKKRKRRKTS
jgi:hypothetical protein